MIWAVWVKLEIGGLGNPVLEVLGVGVALPVDVEPGVPDDVQVVADAPTELGGLLVFEFEVEFPADPAQRASSRPADTGSMVFSFSNLTW